MNKLILAVVWAVIVTLGCVLVGSLLSSINVQVASVIGGFLQTYSYALGLLYGLYFYFT